MTFEHEKRVGPDDIQRVGAGAPADAGLRLSPALAAERIFYLDDAPILVKAAEVLFKKHSVTSVSLIHVNQTVDEIIVAMQAANPTIVVFDFSLAGGLKSSHVVDELITRHPQFLHEKGIVFYSSEVGEPQFESVFQGINQRLYALGHLPAVALAKPKLVEGIQSVFLRSRFGS